MGALGEGVAWADGVDVDPVGGEFAGKGLSKADDGEFGCAVRGVARISLASGRRGHVDDLAAVAAIDQVPGHGARAEKGALDVDGLHLVPGGFAQVYDWDAIWPRARASVVDQQVDAAKAGERTLHHALDLGRVGYVGLHRESLLTGGFDFGDKGGQAAPAGLAIGLGVQVIDYEVAAFAR